MKRIINTLCLLLAFFMVNVFAANGILLTNSTGTIQKQYGAYNSSDTWEINTGTNKAIHLRFALSLGPCDQVLMYQINDAGGEELIFDSNVNTYSGTLTDYEALYSNGKAKIVLYSNYDANYANGYTNYTGLYLEYFVTSRSNLSNGNAVIAGNLGLGIMEPLAKLHINGAIRGTETEGALRVSTTSGNLRLGYTANYDITTDREYLLLDKALRTTPGQIGSGYSDLSLQTWGTTRMTIKRYSGYVGIGTTTINQALTLKGNMSASPSGTTPVETYNGSLMITKPAASGQYINLARSGNSTWSIGTVYNSNTFAIGQANTADASFTAPVFNITTTGNVGIGAIAPQCKLDVAGTIRAAEVKIVSINQFADFVFDKSYELPALKDVHSFIQKNGHLPNIPSAKEAKENGIDLAEMQVKLLQKVEELTLYALDQQKHIEEQQKRIEELEKSLK